MKVKEAILFLLLFSGLLGCECFDAGTEWNIDGFELSILDKNDNYPFNGMVEGDSVKLTITFAAEFVDLYTNPFRELQYSAFATSCAKPGDDGLNDDIEHFKLYSSADFNSIPAGEPLNELLLVNGRKSIVEWLESSKNWAFRFHNFSELVFTERPEVASTHMFTIQVILRSGETMERSTDEIQWN